MLSDDDQRALAALANGIIPADDLDAGAACVNAGPRLADKIAAGVNAAVYTAGLARAVQVAAHRFDRRVADLAPAQVHHVLGVLRDEQPGFFRQLRTDVCAIYLIDPAVWERIGFPGPSAARRGYPDFDRQQFLNTVAGRTMP